MNLRVLYEEQAINQAAGFLTDDPGGVAQLMDALDGLASNPRPPESFPYGSPDLRRLRTGRYRVMYEIRGDTIVIGSIARRLAAG